MVAEAAESSVSPRTLPMSIAQSVCVLQLCLCSRPVCWRSLALAAVLTNRGLMWTFCGLIGILHIVCCSCFSISGGLAALCLSWSFPNHVFCAWGSSCSPFPSLPLAEMRIYKQFTCPPDTHLLSFKHQLAPLHSFSTCRHSRLRASLNVQVVMTTMSAAFSTTLRVWRSSYAAARLQV